MFRPIASKTSKEIRCFDNQKTTMLKLNKHTFAHQCFRADLQRSPQHRPFQTQQAVKGLVRNLLRQQTSNTAQR